MLGCHGCSCTTPSPSLVRGTCCHLPASCSHGHQLRVDPTAGKLGLGVEQTQTLRHDGTYCWYCALGHHWKDEEPHKITQHRANERCDCLLIGMVWLVCVRVEVWGAVCFDQPWRTILICDDIGSDMTEVISTELLCHERGRAPAAQ